MVELAHNKDAERSVLAAAIKDPSAVCPRLLDKISSTDFLNPAHTIIFSAVLDLFGREATITAITLSEEIKRLGKLPDIGGAVTIATILETPIEPIEAVLAHAAIVVEKARVRQAASALEEAQKSLVGSESRDAATVMSAGQRILDIALKTKDYRSVRPLDGAKEILQQVQMSMDRGGHLIGLPTGFDSLDRAIFGFEPGRLYLFAARPAVGKSAILLNLAETMAVKNRVHTLYISLEMHSDELYMRLYCGRAGVDSKVIKLGLATESTLNKIRSAVEEVSSAPLEVDDLPARSIDDLRLRIFKFVKQVPNGERAIVFVDYLQLVTSTVRERETREREIAQVSVGLKNIAKTLNIPVVAAAQLKRDSEEKKEPQLSDLRESGALEQDADVVILLHKITNKSTDDEINEGGADQPIRPMLLIVTKNRGGAYARLKFEFHSTHTKFVDNCIQYGNSNNYKAPAY